MAISLSSSTVGAFADRLAEAGTLLKWGRDNLRDGGQLHLDLRSFQQAYLPASPSGDIQQEPQLTAWTSRLLVDEQQRFTARMQSLKPTLRETLRTHLWRDVTKFIPTDDSAAMQKLALQELRRQMVAGSALVATCAVAITPTAGASNVGNGTLVTSTKRGDGLVAEVMFAETGDLRIIEDGFVPTGIERHEKFRYVGDPYVDGMHPNWGETGFGSGPSSKIIRVIDPTHSNGRGQCLVNGSMEIYPSSGSTNTPTFWATDGAGTDNLDFQQSSAQAYFGSKSLLLLAGTGVNTSFAQYFNSYNATNATPYKLKGSTPYAYLLRLRSTGTVTAGQMTVALANASSTTINDDQAVANISSAIDLTALSSSSWTTASGVFRTPKNVGNVAASLGPKLRLRVSTAITGANVYVDSVAFAEMIELYPGGPWIAIFAGDTAFVRADNYQDHWSLATTNDNAGAASARKTFHRLTDAVLDLRQHGILLPTGTATWLDADIA